MSAQLLVTRLALPEAEGQVEAALLAARGARLDQARRGWAIAIARASSACICACRLQPMGAADELEFEIVDGAGVAPLIDIGSILRPAAAD